MSEPTTQTWEDRLIADLRAHGGRPSSGPLAGHPLLLLTTTGARSGSRRRCILTYSRDGAAYLVAGTNNAREVDPAWVANVRAHPQVTMEIAGREIEGIARIVGGEERARLWRRHVEQLPWFAQYESVRREIPVVRLTPRQGSR